MYRLILSLPIGNDKIINQSISHFLDSYGRLILFRWKDPAPPAYGHWVREVMCHLKLEKIRYTVRGATGKFYRIWQPFLSFVSDMDADSIVM